MTYVGSLNYFKRSQNHREDAIKNLLVAANFVYELLHLTYC